MGNDKQEDEVKALNRAAFQDESLWLLYLYWRQLPHTDGIPSRKAIDPTEIPSAVLPCVFMIDVNWQGDDPSFSYRLVGTKVINNYGINFAGKTPDEAFPDSYQKLEHAYAAAARSRNPSVDLYNAPLEEKRHKMVERLLCPCAEKDSRVDLLFGALAFSSATGATAYG